MSQTVSPATNKALIKIAFIHLVRMHEILEDGYATLSDHDLDRLHEATELLASIIYPALDQDVLNLIHIPAEPELIKLMEQGEKV